MVYISFLPFIKYAFRKISQKKKYLFRKNGSSILCLHSFISLSSIIQQSCFESTILRSYNLESAFQDNEMHQDGTDNKIGQDFSRAECIRLFLYCITFLVIHIFVHLGPKWMGIYLNCGTSTIRWVETLVSICLIQQEDTE